MKAALIAAGLAASPALGQLGTNLLHNPSFELFTPQPDGTVSVQGEAGQPDFLATLSAWELLEGTLTLDRYDGQYGPASGTPADAGVYYLFGAFVLSSTITQTVSIDFAQAATDNGLVLLHFQGLLGSYVGGTFPQFQDDIATVVIECLDAQSDVLEELTITGPSVPQDVGLPQYPADNFQYPYALVEQVPPGTTSIRLTINLERDADAQATAFNNANVDRLSLVLSERCPADLTAPFGILNFFDLAAFIALYNAQDPAADLAAPLGTLNFFDVAAYIDAYNAGCP